MNKDKHDMGIFNIYRGGCKRPGLRPSRALTALLVAALILTTCFGALPLRASATDYDLDFGYEVYTGLWSDGSRDGSDIWEWERRYDSGAWIKSYVGDEKNVKIPAELGGWPVLGVELESEGLTGIDLSECIDLEILDCSFNELTSLDVSKNKKLDSLSAHYNKLTGLSLNDNTDLELIEIHDNSFTSIDLSKLSKLVSLRAYNNDIGTLDVSKNSSLKNLEIYGNNLATLDVSKNPLLADLKVSHNNIAELDIKNNPALARLLAHTNQLTALDVSRNPLLIELDCSDNQLTALDISNLAKLGKLNCYNNELTALDVEKSPLLTELDVGGNKISALNVDGLSKLEKLDCGVNKLKALDISRLTNLEYLDCSENEITSLVPAEGYVKERITHYDRYGNVSWVEIIYGGLKELHCYYNKLTSLDVSSLVPDILESLQCQNNYITTFNPDVETLAAKYGRTHVLPQKSEDDSDGDGYKSGRTETPTDITKAVVSVSGLKSGALIWTGSQIKPKVTVSYGGKKYASGTDFTVSYGANKNIGKASVKITGTGESLTGAKTVNFKIVPKKPTGLKLKAGKGSLKVTFEKVSAAQKIKTYKVTYRVKGESKWKSKTVTVKLTGKAAKKKAVTVTLKTLKSKKTYQVRVYAYKGAYAGAPTGIKSKKIK